MCIIYGATRVGGELCGWDRCLTDLQMENAPKCHFSQYSRTMEEIGLRSESIQRRAIFPS